VLSDNALLQRAATSRPPAVAYHTATPHRLADDTLVLARPSAHSSMRFVALVSGGKDSVFSLGKALAHGHELVCLANLYPPDTGPEELDSFMFQSAGATALEALAECLGVPLLRAPLRGGSGHQGLHYAPTEGDEVEDLYDLIRHVKASGGGWSGWTD
jgi:hypothetical protein